MNPYPPTDIDDIPSLTSGIIFGVVGGLFTGVSNNLINQLPPLFRPHKTIYYSILGGIAGAAMIFTAEWCFEQNMKRDLWLAMKKEKLEKEIERRKKQ